MQALHTTISRAAIERAAEATRDVTDADASTVLEALVKAGELDDERVDLMLRLAAETRIRARMKQEAGGAL